MNYNINIARTILSSIIFDPKNFETVQKMGVIAEMFASWAWVWKSMEKLEGVGEPIEESFIMLRAHSAEKNADQLLEIMSANPVPSENLGFYVAELKREYIQIQRSIAYQKLSIALSQNDDIAVVVAKSKLQELDNLEKVENVDIFDLAVKSEDLENISFEYLKKGVIEKQKILMIFGPSGSGKTLAAVALANELTKTGAVMESVILDLDNGKNTLKKRSYDRLVRSGKVKFILGADLEKARISAGAWLTKAAQIDNTDRLYIIDSASLAAGGEKPEQVAEFMSIIKKLRDSGATVMLIHHSKKRQIGDQNLGGDSYYGSFVWGRDIDASVQIVRQEHNGAILFIPRKDRDQALEKKAFFYDEENILLKEAVFEDVAISDIDASIIDVARSLLVDGDMSQEELIAEIKSVGVRAGNAKIRNVLQKYAEKFWSAKKGDKNATIYMKMRSETQIGETKISGFEEIEITIEDFSKVDRKTEKLKNSDFSGFAIEKQRTENAWETEKLKNSPPVIVDFAHMAMAKAMGA